MAADLAFIALLTLGLIALIGTGIFVFCGKCCRQRRRVQPAKDMALINKLYDIESAVDYRSPATDVTSTRLSYAAPKKVEFDVELPGLASK
ncbi:hypothetical protein BCR33DRAFT_790041 [Rhizoclosmatium globosum]|uniref:Uncharacterized protein n=1 Tax=Rhizoclosmatium globosum TaxID=329046 RepID=A0A1Y2BQ51_9FUNG|nr:hypothetical protein BCR33DRAFT_790041 [Rhizoclosmatium globosum]|eukprot:ORY36881.1 hypothetical protein BCR33DRAFT_790041 [Rhizoclosmatium globosum]